MFFPGYSSWWFEGTGAGGVAFRSASGSFLTFLTHLQLASFLFAVAYLLYEFENRFDLGPARLLSVRSQLETHYKDMQDIEFTIQQGKLYMLQTRNGKRTAPAALQIAVDMAKEGLITKAQALMSLKPDLIDQLLHPTLDPKAKKDVIAKGLPASPGAAGGKVSWLEILFVSICFYWMVQSTPAS